MKSSTYDFQLQVQLVTCSKDTITLGTAPKMNQATNPGNDTSKVYRLFRILVSDWLSNVMDSLPTFCHYVNDNLNIMKTVHYIHINCLRLNQYLMYLLYISRYELKNVMKRDIYNRCIKCDLDEYVPHER
jgi:hypothetical protein